jgi:parallel beta-helix repeat protein
MGKYIIGVILAIALVAIMSAEKAHALACGDTISGDTTLMSNLGPCAGDGLIIDTADVTLDLNHKKITGSGLGDGVRIEGVEDVTVKNGTIQNFNIGVDVESGSDGTHILEVTSKDHKLSATTTGGSGVAVADSADVVIKECQVENVEGSGLDIVVADNLTMEHNELRHIGTGTQEIPDPCGTGNGIFIYGSDGAQILNNTFQDVSQSGILYWSNTNGLIDGNTVMQTSSRPCGPGNGSTDFGAITITAASTDTTISGNVVTDNDDAAIGLRSELVDIRIVGNRLERNTKGIFLSRGASGNTFMHNNCISKDATGIGLETDPTDALAYSINAENNFWGAADGPSGDGPLGSVLTGSGEEIDQKATDSVDVEPFLSKCHIDEKSR